ncbi:MAG: hypothetical protein JW779_13185 [Candidatus Thorarchaeota archaeon]|nr:hypothetical protein [Candidatus Thorarchaeota archaeon]
MKYHLGFQTADKYTRETCGTGVIALDTLLQGGYEQGLVHLFYGAPSFQEDLLRAAVWAQVSKSRGGLESPVIMIDSSNMIDTTRLTEYAFEYELEIESVMDHIFISRAFNSSQTYDLLTNHLEEFLERIPARMLLVPGLPDLFVNEGLDSTKTQQLTHLASLLMAITMRYNLVTLVSTKAINTREQFPAVGRSLASNAQIHILIEQTPMRVLYTLTKHPSLPIITNYRTKHEARFGVTLPLDYFFDEDLST